MAVDLDKWARGQVEALVALGDDVQDAERYIKAVLSWLPEGADPSTFVPTEEQLDSIGVVDEAATHDARVVWYSADWVQGKYRRLLDARSPMREWDPDQPRDELGRFGSGGGGRERRAQKQPAEMVARVAAVAIEREIMHNTTESAAAFDANGAPVLIKTGDESSIHFTEAELGQLRGTTFTHNHPRGTSFSEEDIRFFEVAEVAELRVVGTNSLGDTFLHTMRPDGPVTPEVGVTIRATFDNQRQLVRALYTKLIINRNITVKEADAHHYHELWSRIDKDLAEYYKDAPAGTFHTLNYVRTRMGG